jgi:hypothetical protein
MVMLDNVVKFMYCCWCGKITPFLRDGYANQASIKQINGFSEVSLAFNESRAMRQLLENGPLSDRELFEEYTYLSEIVKPVLSANLVNVLSQFKSSDDVALLIKGLPIDDVLVSTPKTGYLPNWATPIAVRVQFSIYKSESITHTARIHECKLN